MSGANVNVSDFRPHQRPCVRARTRAQRLAQRSQPDVTALLFITTTWWLCCCCCCYQSCCQPLLRLHSGAVTCNQQLILEWTWWITVVWIIWFVFQPSEASFLARESPPLFWKLSYKVSLPFSFLRLHLWMQMCIAPNGHGCAAARSSLRKANGVLHGWSEQLFFFLSSSPLARVFVPTRFTLFLYSIWFYYSILILILILFYLILSPSTGRNR